MSASPRSAAQSPPARTGKCPSCGAPIEFKLGSSVACICAYCRFSIARKGGQLEAIGKVADLVPSAPRMSVDDAGSIEGRAFTVGGRLQLDHGRGPWDEWYVELEPGRWGWVAYAQGRSYITFPQDARGLLPGYDALEPGMRLQLAGYSLHWTVTEVGRSTLVSAEGELPLPAVPGERGRYADLVAENELFATLDYGADDDEPPRVYVGRRVPESGVVLTRTALGPRPTERVQTERLRCPQCGGPIELRLPNESERATCPSCRALLDCDHGSLRYVRTLEARRSELLIPLGTSGTLCGEDVIVTGFVERTTTDGEYRWNEYLLHTPKGYRWLVEDARHFTYVRDISAADVESTVFGVRYRSTSYKRFGSSTAAISYVLGELYWKAEVGDRAKLADYIAPPEVVSSEESANELVWSLGTYVPARDVWKGLGLPGSPLYTAGVGACQPNPVRLRPLAIMTGVFVAILIVLGIALEGGVGKEVAAVPLKLRDAGASQEPEDTVVYSERFEVARGPTTLEIELDTDVANGWVSVAAALIDDDTQEVRELYLGVEEWHGVSDGESWQEGSPKSSEYLGKVHAGRYVLRFDAQWGREGNAMNGPTPRATAKVVVGSRSIGSFFLALLALLVPLGLSGIRKVTFESKRWRNSDIG